MQTPLRTLLLLVWVVLLSPALVQATPATTGIPDPLKPWIDWVLHDQEDRLCPMAHDNASERPCQWPGRLHLRMETTSGQFTLQTRAIIPGWHPLPGDPNHWPLHVKVDDKPAVVTTRDQAPGVWLTPGSHSIQGRFAHATLPEFLRLPREIGLIVLTLSGKPQPFATPDEQGRLWLQAKSPESPPSDERSVDPQGPDQLDVTVHRLLRDGVPIRLETRIELRVAGRPRDIVLPNVRRGNWIPMRVESQLPLRLEPDGAMTIQAKPGVWRIDLEQRAVGPLESLERPAERLPPWPEEEFLAFAADHRMRIAALTGLGPIDPRQTAMPDGWRDFPTFRFLPGDRAVLKENQRGEIDPSPERLSLTRQLWLDFSGAGWTIQDRIQGKGTGSWRLEMQGPTELGRVEIKGENQFITRLPDGESSGVEVRERRVELIAESRLPRHDGRLPAVGWDLDFQKVTGTLHLPPGWRLLHATGVDDIGESWLGRWSLLDLFLILVTALAASRLWGRSRGGATLLALALIHPEEPGLAWNLLSLMAVDAALRVVPGSGWIGYGLKIWRLGALAMLVTLVLPFLITQARQGLHPQLERPSITDPAADASVQARSTAIHQPLAMAPPPVGMATPAPEMAEARDGATSQPVKTLQAKTQSALKQRLGHGGPLLSGSAPAEATPSRPLMHVTDPKAVSQTGPGLPAWKWREIGFQWSGPVTREQTMQLHLLPPWANRLMIVARILLALLLTAWVLGARWSPRRDPSDPPGVDPQPEAPPSAPGPAGPATALAVTLLVALPLFGLAPNPAWSAGIPDEKMLDTLRERLLEPPACLPACADLQRLRVETDGNLLRMRLEMHAAREVAIPLPGQAGQWLPEEIWLNGKSVTDIRRKAHDAHSAKVVWIVIPEGIHHLLMQGELPPQELVRLELPMPPRHIEGASATWDIEKFQPSDTTDGFLQLRRRTLQASPPPTRAEPEGGGAPTLERPRVPPTLEVTRILTLGPVWEMETLVRRIAPVDGPIAVELPLVEGESPTSENARVTDGRVKVNLESAEGLFQWRSTLEIRERIRLVAPSQSFGYEIWLLRAAPLWHVALEGVAPVRMSDDAGLFQPEWRPWPGEEARLRILRLTGVEGPTTTLERTELIATPGERNTDLSLTLTLQAGQGGEQIIRLPEGARLRATRIAGREIPLRQDGDRVTVPIAPGKRQIQLDWRQPDGLAFRTATPQVDPGLSGVNAALRLELPPDRWILWTHGPAMGPAVLYWGALGIVLLLSLALGRIPWLPLKSHHWFLLGLGLSTVELVPALILVAWFPLIGWRKHQAHLENPLLFNLRQVLLVAWTVAAGLALGEIFRHGLLGYPQMHVSGNLSHAGSLRWFADRTGPELPVAVVYSLPIMAYRLLMLLWSLWLATALLGWIRWAWNGYATQGTWRTPPPRPPRDPERTGPTRTTGRDSE